MDMDAAWASRDAIAGSHIYSELFRHGWNFPIVIWTIAIEGAIFYVINNIWVSPPERNERTRDLTLIFPPYIVRPSPYPIFQ